MSLEFNRVASVDAKEAVREWGVANLADQPTWNIPKVKLSRISHVIYGHPDLDTIRPFLVDFGMRIAKETATKIWFRGYGADPYVYVAVKTAQKEFLGTCYLVQTFEDLQAASRIPGASEMVSLDDAPGRGQQVTVHDPEGYPVCLLWGQETESPPVSQRPGGLTLNSAHEKPRVGKFQRFREGAAPVHRLGHYGLSVKNFQAQWEFYAKYFNLKLSDVLYEETEDAGQRDCAIFMHIDLGANWTDHHSFFMNSNPTSHVHHCSFEVNDFDTQLMGHEWLAKKGYKTVWGVGRHILGSQIFDYWWDTSGFMVEHYVDGDLVNETTPVGRGPIAKEALAVWGPDVPSSFLS